MWQTEIDIGELCGRIQYSHKILFIGSCFAAEVGNTMKNLRFKAQVNPFGTLFNPASISNSLERIFMEREFDEGDTVKCGDIVKSFFLGSELSASTLNGFIEQNNAMLKRVANHTNESDWIVITLGTSWVYRDKLSGSIVANCHKFPASRFTKELLEVEQMVEMLSPLIERHPQKRWIFTVSPVRHLKDGATENMRSKARLILVVERLCQKHTNVHYFPAYELFMDELRDYRFYASDMVHPSQDAVQFTWKRFCSFALDSSCLELMKMVESLNRMKAHRPIFPESKDYKLLQEKIESLELKLAQEGL